LNTPVNNPISSIKDNEQVSNARKRRTEYGESFEDKFPQLKELKELKEFKEQLNQGNSDHSLINVHTTSSNLNESNESSTMNSLSINSIGSSSPFINSSVNLSTSNSSTNSPIPTTLPTSMTNDQILIDLPFISHNSIKQKDLNKLILLKQQELAETVRNNENNLYSYLVKESEQQFEDNPQKDPNNEEHKQTGDTERLSRISICLKCHYSCRQCTGRRSTQCTACYLDSQLDQYGRCIFKDIAIKLDKYKSTSVWPSSMSFNAGVQNWITIFSLILCFFFSMAFFYLLLCKKSSSSNNKHITTERYNNGCSVDYCGQAKQLPIECTNQETYPFKESNREPLTNHHEFKEADHQKSFLRLPFLNQFKEEESPNRLKSSPKVNHLDVHYKNLPVQFDVKQSNGMSELNEITSEIG